MRLLLPLEKIFILCETRSECKVEEQQSHLKLIQLIVIYLSVVGSSNRAGLRKENTKWDIKV